MVSVPERQPTTVIDPASDAALMARTRAGDRDAFGLLVDRHKDALVGYLARLTGSPDRAQDLAQEAFLRLYRAAGSYRERGQLTAFLYRIATNLVRSEARRERRWRQLLPHLAPRTNRRGAVAGAPAPAIPGDRLEAGVAPAGPRRLRQREVQRRLSRALATLPVELRAPLLLYEIEEWSQADIARALGCREGTVKSRLFRARRRLRDELADCWDEWNDGGPS